LINAPPSVSGAFRRPASISASAASVRNMTVDRVRWSKMARRLRYIRYVAAKVAGAFTLERALTPRLTPALLPVTCVNPRCEPPRNRSRIFFRKKRTKRFECEKGKDTAFEFITSRLSNTPAHERLQ
jgi:hypothetical protein